MSVIAHAGSGQLTAYCSLHISGYLTVPLSREEGFVELEVVHDLIECILREWDGCLRIEYRFAVFIKN